MDHTMQAYLKRCSTEQLMGFLEDCMRKNLWGEYALTIPAVFTVLQKRNILLPEQIRTSWNAYIGEKNKKDAPIIP